MKTVIQALVASIAMHLLYFLGTMLAGFVKTLNYQPEIGRSWDNVEMLQSEVAFGYVASTNFYYLYSFLGVTVVCGILIFLFKKLNRE
ncbi:membrane protein [Ornithinibacillus californiensis]|uniref:membrane protein n=1 Tax=Ornithinibacillus californiensis TaxID=161536 RepID=UPI00064DA038|nr:membrane protein [Ornithinibacillus californiensis]